MRPGEAIGRYVVEGLLGRGGMADVYAALDTRLGRRVALKRLRSGGDDPAFVRRRHPGAARPRARRALGVRGLATVGALSLFAIAGAAVTGRLSITNPLGAEPVTQRVDAVACREAVVSGDGASPALAAAIGAGACVRLAVELDVEWAAPPPADALDVVATITPGGAEVTLRSAGAAPRRRA